MVNSDHEDETWKINGFGLEEINMGTGKSFSEEHIFYQMFNKKQIFF